jgi:hypothetical protein
MCWNRRDFVVLGLFLALFCAALIAMSRVRGAWLTQPMR